MFSFPSPELCYIPVAAQIAISFFFLFFLYCYDHKQFFLPCDVFPYCCSVPSLISVVEGPKMISYLLFMTVYTETF